MEQTTNYNLNLPAYDDLADIEKINENTRIIDSNLKQAADKAAAALPATSYTAEDILNKLKTVDGANSGLDADLFRGQSVIPVENGGTGATTVDTARENLNALRKVPYYVPGSIEYDVDTAIFDAIIISLAKVPDLYNVIGGTAAYIWQFFYQAEESTSTRVQIAHGYSNNKMATRIYYQGAWSAWEEILTGPNEAIQAEMLLSQQDIIIKQNEHDEVLAAILLEQQTV